MTRLKDLADAAGVSIRTVTRALRNAPDVNTDTRERIRKLAGEMRYRPDLAARGLKTRKSFAVGMVLGNLDELTVAKTAAFENHLRRAGYALELLFSRSKQDLDGSDLETLEALLDRRPAGVAMMRFSREIRDLAARSGTPCVLIDAPEKQRFDAVIIDRPKGVSEAVNHLLAKGRTRVAYLGPDSEAGGRRLGYRQAINAHKPSRRPIYIPYERPPESANGQFHEGKAAADGIAESGPVNRPDAVICYTDHMALGLLHGFHRYGIRVPDEIAVIGFDDRSAAALSTPRLTTVAQPNQDVGRQAAQMLLKKIAARDASNGKRGMKVPSVVVPTRLVMRESG